MACYEYAILHGYVFHMGTGSVSRPLFLADLRKRLPIVEVLNVIGMEGWELVSVKDDIFYFKREIQSDCLEKHTQGLNAGYVQQFRKFDKEMALEEKRTAKLKQLERAYRLLETIPNLKNESACYAAVEQLKNEDINFDEFKRKIDELTT